MKHIEAQKVRDGWHVKIIETHHIHSESDVYKFAKQNGMVIKSKLKDPDDEVLTMSGD